MRLQSAQALGCDFLPFFACAPLPPRTFEFADGGTLAGATLTAFDTRTAQELFLGGEDEFNDIWVSADGVSQEELRDAVAEPGEQLRPVAASEFGALGISKLTRKILALG